ncbi:MAG: calcium-translocating P-type ATPase [Clostridiales bacterium]|nr:calcium-translocating P-type ATPase [Clostridiales bacterium]
MSWHSKSSAEVLRELKSDPRRGLDEREARRRVRRYGPNSLPKGKGPSPWRIFFSQFSDFMVLVLLAAALLSFLLGEGADGLAIMAILTVNAFLGFYQEYRAERSLEALRELASPRARVLRQGREVEIPGEEVVPGDILLLEAGDRVAADARLLEAFSLEVEEALLTGESLPAGKDPAPFLQENLPLGDRKNMVFQGTFVVKGRGKAVVVATGPRTEMGRIAEMMSTEEEAQTPLQVRLSQLGRILVVACLSIAAFIAALGVIQGKDPYLMFFSGVSLAVAAIPEGLPITVTVALAIGVQRMARARAIIRRLPAVETLGCATVILTDKTGTLTRNEMEWRLLWREGKVEELTALGERREDLELLFRTAFLCNDVRGEGEGVRGDPTEVALWKGALGAGWAKERWSAYRRMGEVPFDSHRKRMTVWARGPDGDALYVKGAPEGVVARCRWVMGEGGIRPVTEETRRAILKGAEDLAREAYRVLALAFRPWEGRPPAEDDEDQLIFLGLAALKDPPRPEASRAVAQCRQAGLRVLMVTGDHGLTAAAIAREVGILQPGQQVLLGEEMDSLEDEGLWEKLKDAAVLARVSPLHKLRVARLFQAKGHVVAMTGDGVNDAPALKLSDIGIAMGKTGSDVAKEAADVLLTDDNFATIVGAIREGRVVYDNIRKFVRYLLSSNTGEILVMLGAVLLNAPLPLLPVQMLLVNLVTDGLPALALGVDPADPGIMRRPPRDPKEGIFARGLGRLILVRGFIIGCVSLYAFLLTLTLTHHVQLARTLAMVTLCLSQFFHALDARSEIKGIWGIRPWENRHLLLALAVSFSVLWATIYLPPLASIFGSVPLLPEHWMLALTLSGGGALLASLYTLVRVARWKVAAWARGR